MSLDFFLPVTRFSDCGCLPRKQFIHSFKIDLEFRNPESELSLQGHPLCFSPTPRQGCLAGPPLPLPRGQRRAEGRWALRSSLWDVENLRGGVCGLLCAR